MADPGHINIINQIQKELDQLNEEWVDAEHGRLKANSCYHFETDPPHILFNLNCPPDLQDRLKNILSKYTGDYESHSFRD